MDRMWRGKLAAGLWPVLLRDLLDKGLQYGAASMPHPFGLLIKK